MITIYHQQLPEDPDQRSWDPWSGKNEPAPWPNRYVKVAEVNTDDLETAWHLTHYIDHLWTTNADVTPIGQQHRSSTIGDVFDLNGKLFAVHGIGFGPLEVK